MRGSMFLYLVEAGVMVNLNNYTVSWVDKLQRGYVTSEVDDEVYYELKDERQFDKIIAAVSNGFKFVSV
jgi:hypothetical protein